TFKYSNLKLVKGDDSNPAIVTAQVDIENTGKVPGAEIAELYVHERKPHLFRPEKELKGFKRVFLQPGQKETVAIPLGKTAFAYYDPARKSWVAQKDQFRILLGSSSKDIRLSAKFNLPETLTLN
ncbi:MAG: fibronectin type III-like domain-contianing protein, partial [Limisphaerales bacterium]